MKYRTVVTKRLFPVHDARNLTELIREKAVWTPSQSSDRRDLLGVESAFYDLDDGSWWPLHGYCEKFLRRANERWRFKLTDWEQPLRAVRYRKGGHHEWHTDYSEVDGSKLSFSCVLSTDYEGGEMQFMDVPDPVLLDVGQAAVFPAYVPHRVNRIKRGERLALLGWMTGPRFR